MEVVRSRPIIVEGLIDCAIEVEDLLRAFDEKEERCPNRTFRSQTYQPSSKTDYETKKTDEGKKSRHSLKLTNAEFSKRKTKGLCYNCEEKYTLGHCCKKELCIVIASKVSEDSDYLDEDSYLFAHEGESRLIVAYVLLRSVLGRSSK